MRHILFVDDEPRILDGLRRMLRGQRDAWDMTFVPGGEPALEVLAGRPVDAIVSDMRMPGMDGATLLGRVRDRHPGVVRLVLSGDAELESAIRTVPVAHQFLTKPCEAPALREAIERACALQSLLADPDLRTAVSGLEALPSLPRVYAELVEALASPRFSLRDIARVVEQDAAMTARCLQLANSAFFGLVRRVTRIEEAVTYLGTNLLRNLVLSSEAFRGFDSSRLPGLRLEELQAHALAASRLAVRICPDRRGAEDAFLAAMLRDVGKLVLACSRPGPFGAALRAAAAERLPLHAIEERGGGVTHAEVGAYLLGLWGLPYPVVEAVAHHHRPGRVRQQGFNVLTAVHVADALTAPGPEAADLDLEHLRELGVAAKLPEWRAIAASLAAAPGGPTADPVPVLQAVGA